jgi:adhesin/invasin
MWPLRSLYLRPILFGSLLGLLSSCNGGGGEGGSSVTTGTPSDSTVVTQATITGNGPIQADGSSPATITIYLKNSKGQGVAGVTPTFTATNTGNTNTYGACSVTVTTGLSRCTLTSTTAETKNLRLTTPIIVNGGTVVFHPGPVSAANSDITGTSPTEADGVSTSTITVTLRDASNNPAVGQVPTFSATGSTNTVSACSTTDASGEATCALASTTAEVKTLSITAPVNKTGGTVTFIAGAAVAATSTISGTGPVVADGVATSTITVTLRDAGNNPVPGETPVFAAGGTNNTASACSVTDVNGEATCTLTSTKAESKLLSITSPVTKPDGSVLFIAGTVDATHATITGSGPVVADGASTSTVTVYLADIFDNPVAGLTPTFSSSGTSNTLGACGVTNASGNATCTLASTKAESKNLAIVTPVVKAGGSVVFIAGAPVALNSNISGTGPVIADNVAVSTITITLADAFNNPVAALTPTFTASGTGNTVAICSASDVTGTSSCTLKSTKAETKTLSIATPVVKIGGTVVFDPGPPAAATSLISGTTTIVADGVATSTVTVTLKDAGGNPAPGFTPTFSATGTGNTLSACSVGDASGVSTCTLASTKAESKTLAIVTPVAKSDGSVVFVAGAVAAATSTITGTSPVTADGVATSFITITLLDAFSNPVAGVNPFFLATDTGGDNANGGCSATNASGVSSCTLSSLTAEVKTLTITSPVNKSDGTVTFTAGAPIAANSNITGTSTVIANGVATSTITITLRDAANNPVPGLTPTFSADGTANSYGACSVTSAGGIATCTMTSTKAEVKTLSIVTPVVKADGTVTFIAGAAAVATSTITGTSPVVADGAATSTVTVTLLDAFSNPVSGSTPTFTTSGTGNTQTACSVTDAIGVATCTLKSTKAEVKTLAIATPVVKTDGTVTFTAGTPIAANSTITGTSPVVADGVATSTVTVTLNDANNNPVEGLTPTFAVTGTNNTLAACSATDVTGVATCTLASTMAETKTLSILTPVAKTGGTVVFEPGAPVAVNSNITGTGSVTADGVATSTITITLRDGANNPVPAVTPTFTASGTANTTNACSATNASGVATCTLTSTKAEIKTLSIATPIVKAEGTVTFTAGAIAAATSTITGTGPVIANDTATSTVTITLLDAFSNPVSGSTPTFSLSGTGNTLTACSASNASGVSTCTAKSTDSGVKTLAIVTPVAKTDGTITFTAGTPVAINSNITGTGPVVANGSSTSLISVTLRDASNNPVPGFTPTFGTTGTSNTLSACSVTDASGVATCTLASTKAEVKTLSILTPVSKTDGTVTFTADAASIANSSITGSGPVVADNVATSTVTVNLKDSNNNAVVGTTPTFTATSAGNTYGACSATDASGDSVCTFTSTKAEVKTLSIATPIVKADGTVTFTAGSPAVATSTITGTGPVVADGVATSTVTVTILDQFSNPISGSTPTFSATGTGNTLSACSATDVSGIATCSLSSTVSGVKTLAIVTPVAKTDGSVTFTAGTPIAANSNITGTGPVVANGSATSAVTVTLRDASNNPVPGQTPTFTASGTNNTASACSVTNASGEATCTLSSIKAEIKTLSIATPFVKADGTVTFTADSAAVANSSITGTGSVVADGVATSTVTITLLDSNNNAVVGTTPTFTASGTGTTPGSCSATDASGIATCTLVSTKAEIKTLSIATPIVKADGTVTFTAGSPAVATSTITGTGPVVADGTATSTVTITIFDQFSNPVSGSTPTFSASGAGNTLSACSSTDVSGIATCTLSSTASGVKTLAIVTPVAKTDGSVTFTAGTPVAVNSNITGTSPVVANGSATSAVTVTLRDASNNPVPGQTPTFTASGTNNTASACSVTDASGIATCTLASTKAEIKTLSIATPFVKADGTVTFTADSAAVANSSITGTSPVVADGVATSTVTITLMDSNNNAVVGTTPTFTASGTMNTTNACSATNASGESTCTLTSTKAEIKTLSIATPIVKADGTVTFTAGAAAVATSTITGSGPVIANGVATSTVTVTLLDAFSNPVAGTTPTFSTSGTNNTQTACGITNASGAATCTLTSTTAETKTLSITAPISKTGGTVVFTAGAAVALNSNITGTSPVVADNTATSTVTVTLRDANNNPVSGQTPTFTTSGTGNTQTACGVTNASGVSTCTVRSTVAEIKTLAIATPVVKTDGTITFTAGAAAVANSTITGSGPVTADGVATSSVTVTLKDANNNSIVGTTPVFSASGTGNTASACSSTDASGIATCTLASTVAEVKTLSITSPISKADGTVTFTAGAAVAGNSTIVGSGPLIANNVATSTVTITLRDASNNAVAGQTPTFTTTGTGNTQTACGVTNASGVATCTVRSTKAEVKTLAIATPVVKTGGTVTFNPGPASNTTTTIVGTGPVTANGVATSFITITILDAFSNPISGTTPIFNATNTGATNSYGACSASNVSGVASCTLASLVAETKTLQLTSPTAVTGGTVVFTAAAPSALTSTIAGTGPVTADGVATSTVTITLRDVNSNAVPGQTPTFGATNTGSTNVSGSCTMGDTNGVSSCTLTSTKAEVKTLSIATPVVKAGGTVTFIAGAPGSQSTITGTSPVLADGNADSTITITIKDNFGNVIAGETPDFSATGTGNNYDTCSVGNASGVSTCLMQSTVAEVKTLSITAPTSLTGGTVTFTAGGADATNSTIVGSGPVIANNIATSTVTVTLKDALNNSVVGSTPTFTTSGTGNTQTACSATNASGVATCTVRSTVAEVKTLAIATPVVKTGGTVTFTAGPADATNSTITGTGPIAADGTSTSTITVTLKDANNNNISGTIPTFSSTGTGNTLTACSSSNASGVSTCTLASSVAETKTLAIVTPVAKTDGTVVFQSGGASALNSTITGSGPVTANGVATSTVTITLKDNLNNSVAGVVPTFSATDTGVTNVNGVCSATNASGVSTCTLASTKAEIKTLSIATPVVKLGGNVTFAAGPVSAATSTIVGTSPTLADGIDTAGITITLLDAFNNPIVATVPTFSATGTLNTPTACTSSDSAGVSSCTLKSTKAEGKTIALVTPVAVAGATLDFNPNGINLQVPIEMISRGLIAATTSTTFARSRTSLNTDDYVAQSNTYYFEIIAHNLNTTTAHTARLVDSAGVEIPDSIITVPANTSAANMTRFRVQFTPNDGPSNYRIKLSATAATNQFHVHSAQIIVEQVAATDTKIYIPLVNSDNTSENATDNGTNGQILGTTSTAFTTSASQMTYWQRTDSAYDAIATGSAWTFEALTATSNAAGVATVSLYNRTTTQPVASVTSSGNTNPNLVSTSFAGNASNFVTGNQYDVRYRSNNAAYTTRLFKAGLWIKLKYLKKAEILQRLSMRRSTTTATTNYFDNRYLWDAGAWSNPTVFFQTVGSVTTSAIALFSVSNTDSGSASMTLVSGGSITPDATQSIKRTAALTLVDNDRYFVRHTRTGGTAVMVGAFLVIQVTE